jgi:hypothetical protein
MRVAAVVGNITSAPGMQCSPRHRMSMYWKEQHSECVSMMWLGDNIAHGPGGHYSPGHRMEKRPFGGHSESVSMAWRALTWPMLLARS